MKTLKEDFKLVLTMVDQQMENQTMKKYEIQFTDDMRITLWKHMLAEAMEEAEAMFEDKRILTINGKEISEIREELRSSSPADE